MMAKKSGLSQDRSRGSCPGRLRRGVGKRTDTVAARPGPRRARRGTAYLTRASIRRTFAGRQLAGRVEDAGTLMDGLYGTVTGQVREGPGPGQVRPDQRAGPILVA